MKGNKKQLIDQYARMETDEHNFAESHMDGFNQALKLARGCLKEYSGGYRDEKLEVYQHGIQTVINVLESVSKNGLTLQSYAVLRSGQQTLKELEETHAE